MVAVCIGGAEREGDKPTNKSDRTYKSASCCRRRTGCVVMKILKALGDVARVRVCVRKHHIFICVSVMHVYVCPLYIYILYVCSYVCVCRGDSALWFLKTFVRQPCPVLCPRACVRVV